MKVLLLGSTGLLGSTLHPYLCSRGYDVKSHSRKSGGQYQVDLTDEKNASELFNLIKPEIIINLTGLTDVELCESSPNQAYLSNVRVVENIAAWIKQKMNTCHLVHISTDQVYDGDGLHEEGRVSLKNYYAFSKYAGELAATGVSSTILRTNFFGRSHCDKKASLTDWLYQSLSSNDRIQVFGDIKFSPVSMATLSELIELVTRKKLAGVFNLGSHDGMSKADFAYAFAEEINYLTKGLTRTSTDQVSFIKTYRPKDMRMNCSKLENTLGIKLPTLRSEIRQVAEDYRDQA